MKVGEDGRWGASAEAKGQWGLRMVIRNLTSLTSSRLHSEHEEPIPARLAEASETGQTTTGARQTWAVPGRAHSSSIRKEVEPWRRCTLGGDFTKAGRG